MHNMLCVPVVFLREMINMIFCVCVVLHSGVSRLSVIALLLYVDTTMASWHVYVAFRHFFACYLGNK